MSKVKRFSVYFVLSLCVVSLLAGGAFAEDYVYATTDMTWAEFYAGEGIVSPDEHTSFDVASADFSVDIFPNFTYTSDDDGYHITGIKAVPVRISEDLWETLSSDTRYTSVDETFTAFKHVISKDSFDQWGTGATNDATLRRGASVAILSGYSNPNEDNDYTLTVANASINAANFLGAYVTIDNINYGLVPYINFLGKTDEIVLNLVDGGFEEGAKLNGITYITLGGASIYVDAKDAVLKYKTSATVTVSGDVVASEDVEVALSFTELSDDATYDKVVSFANKDGDDWDVNEGYEYSADVKVLTIKGTVASGDEYRVIFEDAKYVDIGTTFTVVTATTESDDDDNTSGDKTTSGDIGGGGGGSSSGCDTGLGIFGLAALVGLIGYMKRK